MGSSFKNHCYHFGTNKTIKLNATNLIKSYAEVCTNTINNNDEETGFYIVLHNTLDKLSNQDLTTVTGDFIRFDKTECDQVIMNTNNERYIDNSVP